MTINYGTRRADRRFRMWRPTGGSGQIQRLLDGLLDSFESSPAEGAERRIDGPGLFDGRDLIALGPRVALQTAVPGPELGPEAERAALDRGERHDAHIQRVTVQRIRGDDESGPLFVEREKTNLASLGEPSRRSGGSLKRHQSRVQDATAADSKARRSARWSPAEPKKLAASASRAARRSKSKARRRSRFTRSLSESAPLVRFTSARIFRSREKVLVSLVAIRIPIRFPTGKYCSKFRSLPGG